MAQEWVEVEVPSTPAGAADELQAAASWTVGLEQSFKGLFAWLPGPAVQTGGCTERSPGHARPDKEKENSESETSVVHEHVSALLNAKGEDGARPLLLILPHAQQGQATVFWEVAAAFHGSCLRVVYAKGSDEELQSVLGQGLSDDGLVTEGTGIMILSLRGGVAKTCAFRGDVSSFEELAYFCASVLHSDYLFGAGAFLRKEGFVRFLCPDSMLEVLGDGIPKCSSEPQEPASGTCGAGMTPWGCWQQASEDADPPCAILVTRTSQAPDWFVAASRLLAPRIRSPRPSRLRVPSTCRGPAIVLTARDMRHDMRSAARLPPSVYARVYVLTRVYMLMRVSTCRFGLAGEPAVRKAIGIQDRQLDPKSPSNPSNQSYMLLFLPPPPLSDASSPAPTPVLQFRGPEDVRAAAGFLAAGLAGGGVGSRGSDGSWIALAFARVSAPALRDKLRLLAGLAPDLVPRFSPTPPVLHLPPGLRAAHPSARV